MNNINKNKIRTTFQEFGKPFITNRVYNKGLPIHANPNDYQEHKITDEVIFDSKQEYEYFKILVEKEKKGEISGLELKPVFVLIEGFTHPITHEEVKQVVYKPDFSYFNEYGRLTAIEYKGYYGMSDFMLRKNLFLSIYDSVDYKIIQYANQTLGYIEVIKGHSIKLLKKRVRKQKEYEKYLSLKGKDKYNKKEREFISNYNATHKHIRKRDYINI